MKAIFSCALLAIALSGCSGESSLPEPTGKGSVRVINAIPSAPVFNALIEERSLGQIAYKNATSRADYDDFEYRFNFEAFLAGDTAPTRVASSVIKIEKDTEYNLVLSGDFNNPTVTVQTQAERSFASDSTELAVQVAHLAEGFPPVDVYFADASITPALGQELASLQLGEFADATDVQTGVYVLTVTAAGDPSTIVYQSSETAFNGGQSLLIGLFAPDENDIDPLAVRGFTNTGGTGIISDVSTVPTLRFIHGASDLGPVDVYLEEELTTPVAQNIAFQQITDDFNAVAGAGQLFLAPAGDTSAILFQRNITITDGAHTHVAVLGNSGTYVSTAYIPDRRSVATVANVRMLNLSLDFPVISVFALERGATLQDGDLPRIANTQTGSLSTTASIIEEGSYDFYVSLSGTRDIVAGPLERDVQYGDVIDLILFDTTDPNVGALAEIPAP